MNVVALTCWAVAEPVRRVRGDGSELLEIAAGFRCRDGSQGVVDLQVGDQTKIMDLERRVSPGVVLIVTGELAGEAIRRNGVVIGDRRMVRVDTVELPNRETATRGHRADVERQGGACAA